MSLNDYFNWRERKHGKEQKTGDTTLNKIRAADIVQPPEDLLERTVEMEVKDEGPMEDASESMIQKFKHLFKKSTT